MKSVLRGEETVGHPLIIQKSRGKKKREDNIELTGGRNHKVVLAPTAVVLAPCGTDELRQRYLTWREFNVASKRGENLTWLATLVRV